MTWRMQYNALLIVDNTLEQPAITEKIFEHSIHLGGRDPETQEGRKISEA